MSEPNETREIADRKARAQKIIESPSGYKVCEGCESIVLKKAVTCPNCSGYRFDGTASRVRAQAALLGNRPSISLSAQDFE
jgi:hypothetical protein